MGLGREKRRTAMTFKTTIEDHVLDMDFSKSLDQLTFKPEDDE